MILAWTGASDNLYRAHLVTNLFLLQSMGLHSGLTWNGPSWSISTEWWTYVTFALVCAWLGMRNWMLVLAALVAPVVLLHLSHTGMDTTYDWGLIRCVFGFALGVACFRIYQAWPSSFERLRANGLRAGMTM